jgi:[NiFe] hydrogenase diaphorase moiety large subunit
VEILPDHSALTSDPSRSLVAQLLGRHGSDPLALVQMLREAQATLGWLPRTLLTELSTALALPLGHIEGVASFYRFLHLQPVGAYRVLFSDNITDRMGGSVALMEALCRSLGVRPGEVRADGRVSVDVCSCTGLCDQGPALLINHHQVVVGLTALRIEQIAALIESGRPVGEWPADWSRVDAQVRQADVLLASPLPPGSAIAVALAQGAPALIDEILRSKLRGRGGAGFTTGKKWQLCSAAPGTAHYVVCNADEGEPGTFKDRVLLSTDPDMVFEGMTLAGFAIGAQQGFLYLRGEYRYLLDALEEVLLRRRRQHLLGSAIQGCVGFDFDIAIHLGAGAYVCGEESALIESLEGKRGTPRIRPPFPAECGYRGQPTCVDNVETLCAAARVVLHGAASWAKLGTGQSTGTQLHSVSGDCARPGVYEFPMGATVAHLLDACGARNTQAVQVGGPSGKCLDASEFGRRIAFEDVPTAGAFMIFDQTRDMFEVAHNYAGFFADESCGFCTPCRVGTTLVLRTHDKLAVGRGSARDVAQLAELDQLMHGTTHCGLGGSACNALHDIIAKFRPAYEHRLKSLRFEPAFDLDAELAEARALTGRDDPLSHLEPIA